MKALLVSALLLLCCYSNAQDTSSDTVWLDVRSHEEFASGHLPGAINIPHTEIAAGIAELKLDKNTPIAIYCKSGRRAGLALEVLQQQGYTNLTNKGGYEQLKQQLVSDNERK